MTTKIRIGTSAIQFLSPFDSKKVIYTIWDEDFDLVIKAIRQTKILKKQYAKVGKGFDVILEREKQELKEVNGRASSQD